MPFTKEQMEALAAPLRRRIFTKEVVEYLRWVKDYPNEWAILMQRLDAEREGKQG